jgi:glycolate oxidase
MNWIENLEKIIGKEIIFTDPEILSNYASDYTEDISCLPHVVIKPNTTSDISKVLSFCNKHKVPVTPRGAGTGLSGGSIPIKGGVSLSMEKFDKILDIDEENFQATVESGVINDHYQTAVKEKG